jgi:hypothetical protein
LEGCFLGWNRTIRCLNIDKMQANFSVKDVLLF